MSSSLVPILSRCHDRQLAVLSCIVICRTTQEPRATVSMEPLLYEEPPRSRSRRFNSSKWKRIAAYILGASWVIISGFAMATAVTESVVRFSEEMAACSPDGAFIPFYATKSAWESSQFFATNIVAASSLSFSAAKVLDVAWDLVSRETQPAGVACSSPRVLPRDMKRLTGSMIDCWSRARHGDGSPVV